MKDTLIYKKYVFMLYFIEFIDLDLNA